MIQKVKPEVLIFDFSQQIFRKQGFVKSTGNFLYKDLVVLVDIGLMLRIKLRMH